jgi:uncharacterized membrane protein
LAISIANQNADTLYTKVDETFESFFSFYGLLSSYVVGFVPSLIVGFAYSRSFRHSTTVGQRLLVAALIGAALYFFVCALVLYFLFGGQIAADVKLFTAYAAGAGAVSALLCASIVEMA